MESTAVSVVLFPRSPQAAQTTQSMQFSRFNRSKRAVIMRSYSTLSASIGLSMLLAPLAGWAMSGCSSGTVGDPAGASDGETPGGGPGTGKPPTTPAECEPAATGPALPQAFAVNCGGCHSPYGKSTNGFPDLFAFAGTVDKFKTQVRNGGTRMPAFGEEKISDKDIEGIQAYFAVGEPPALTCDGSVVTPNECAGVPAGVGALFPTAMNDAPIMTRKADGSILLEGAGRVRGRHEHEEEFSKFHPHYFENRSYKFTIEDTIAAGGTTIKFTWLSAGKTALDPNTNFRFWYTGNGNVFNNNVQMTRMSDTYFEFTVEHNDREHREIKDGDLLEFEFGVFLDHAAVEGRTNYYSDTFRYRVGSGKLTPFSEPDDAALSGADGTTASIFAEPELSYEQMALNIQATEIQKFLGGRRLFHTNFTSGEHSEEGNPVFTEQASKAGPLLNQTTCSNCHINNGRGAPPEPGAPMTSMVVKVFGDGSGADGAPALDPNYGRQLQDKALGGAAAEGNATVAYEDVSGAFPDGTAYTLRKPKFSFTGLSAGPVAHYSARVARPVYGMGLLEAIPEDVLTQRADALDCNQDGISGRPNLVPDPLTKELRIGRFGWKAAKTSVPHQVADALIADLGVTTSYFPAEECGANEQGCKGAGNGPELKDEDLDKVAAYMRLLSVPQRRNTADPVVQHGEILFSQAGCANCHAPMVTTGSNHPFRELRNQVIHPYTDLLLHDMGEGLTDASTKDYVAEASEWRTPPLWGIGLVETVNGHTQLLHDGRARSFVEAVLWHGGEAASAKERFMALPKGDRDALVTFIESL